MADDFKLSTDAKIIIVTSILATLLEIIDTSIVNVAIPTMMGNLGATLEDISWVVTGYIIANAIILPISGWLGMVIGRRRYFVTCISMFTIASFACGMAPNLVVLVICRIFQGLAGGALLPTSQALIQEQFPRERAGMANAIYGMGVIIGPTIGPTLGGYLTDNLGWRSIFYINLPLGLIAMALAFWKVRDVQDSVKQVSTGRRSIDLLGLALLVIGIGCLQFVLERGQADDWFSSNMITTCSIAAALAIPLFVWWELRCRFPVMDLRLYKNTVLRLGTILILCVGIMLYSSIFLVPIFAARVMGLTATQTGLLFVPGALVTGLMMPIIGAQLRKRDPRFLIMIGVVVIDCFLLMMTQLTTASGADDLFWPLIIRGFGMAFLFVPINTMVLTQFSGHQLGQVTGMMNFARQMGGSIGVASISTLLDTLSAQKYMDLASHVSLLNPITWQSYHQIQAAMAGKMPHSVGFGTYSSLALTSLKYRISNQIFCLSFDGVIWILALCFGIALIPLALMRKSHHKVSGPVAAH